MITSIFAKNSDDVLEGYLPRLDRFGVLDHDRRQKIGIKIILYRSDIPD
jgi:hypothetical protein